MRRVCGRNRAAFALGAFLSAWAVGCGGGPSDAAAGGEGPRREAAAHATACPLDWPGGFRARPEANWVRALVEHAGYRVVGTPGSTALIATGKGHEFSVWAVQDTPRDPHLADPDEWEVVAGAGDVAIYGRAQAVGWWSSQGFHVWIGRGPRVTSVAPRPDEIAPLVEASITIPAPRPC